MTAPVPKLGVTLYSFTRDFHAGRYTFEDLIVRAAELGLGPGLEVIGFQSFRGFPHISAEPEKRFLGLDDPLRDPEALDAPALELVEPDPDRTEAARGVTLRVLGQRRGRRRDLAQAAAGEDVMLGHRTCTAFSSALRQSSCWRATISNASLSMFQCQPSYSLEIKPS